MVLRWFREVLLQDVAVLYSQHPRCHIFEYRPFNTKTFREFAASSTAAITHAESKARLAYENMPEHLVAGLRGTYSDLRLEQRKEQDENTRRLNQLSQQFSNLESMLSQLLQASQPSMRRSRKGDSSSSSPFSLPLALTQLHFNNRSETEAAALGAPAPTSTVAS